MHGKQGFIGLTLCEIWVLVFSFLFRLYFLSSGLARMSGVLEEYIGLVWIYWIGMEDLGSRCVVFVLSLAGMSWSCTATMPTL